MIYHVYKQSWHTDTHTDAGNDNTRRPILALGKKQAGIFKLKEICFINSLVSCIPLQQYPSQLIEVYVSLEPIDKEL